MGKGWLIAGMLAVGVIYAAGYVRTEPAAGEFEERSAERRRPAAPVRAVAAAPPPIAVPSAPVVAPAQPRVRVAKAKPLKPDDPIPAPWETDEPEAKPFATPPAIMASTAPAVTAPAPGPPPPPPLPVAKPATVWKDGTYQGWGHSRHGDIQASVLIENGRIVSSKISQCLTRYSCDVIDNLIPQPPQRQSADVDAVGGATQSSDAFYYAVSEALAKAK